jgi:endonuclease YncB( thermonuclease family)
VLERYLYRAQVLRVVDGDTLVCEILVHAKVTLDVGFRIKVTLPEVTQEHSIRIVGVNTPELFSGTDRERGAAAKQFVTEWVEASQAQGVRWPFFLETLKDTTSFNRYVGHLTRPSTGESLADAIRAAGFDLGGM